MKINMTPWRHEPKPEPLVTPPTEAEQAAKAADNEEAHGEIYRIFHKEGVMPPGESQHPKSTKNPEPPPALADTGTAILKAIKLPVATLEVEHDYEPLPTVVRSQSAPQPVPAKAEENSSMATTPSKFKSIMSHILAFVTLGLVDIIKYAPPAAALASVLFPETATMDAAAQATAVKVATLIQKTVLTVQQKYATAAAGPETNAQKLADALSIVEDPSIQLLTQAGVHDADTQRITSAINTTVAILNNAPAPVATT